LDQVADHHVAAHVGFITAGGPYSGQMGGIEGENKNMMQTLLLCKRNLIPGPTMPDDALCNGRETTDKYTPCCEKFVLQDVGVTCRNSEGFLMKYACYVGFILQRNRGQQSEFY
jgi:hypothetical protein